MEWIANRYQLVRLLGRGAMSEVWLARDRVTKPERTVALKLIPSESDAYASMRREFFDRETRALSLLNHPRVVRLLESGEDTEAGKLYIALEYVDGANLEERLANWRPTLNDSISIGVDLLEALVSAHRQGIIHRDIKPRNIMVGVDGEVKLVDFGVSRLTHEARLGHTVRGFMSVPYASPEQRRAEDVTVFTDLYSLGAVVFRLVSAKEPPDPMDWEPAIDSVALPPRLKDWLTRMVALEPSSRYRSASEARRELMTALQEVQVDERPEYHVRVTQYCLQRLVEFGHVSSTSDAEAVTFLQSDLNGEVHLKHDQNGQLVLVGTQVAYRCAPDSRAPLHALALTSVLRSNPENLEHDREVGLPVNAKWVVHGRQDSVSDDADITELLERMEKFKKASVQRQQEEMSHKDFLREWESVLKLERKLLETNSFQANYQSWDVSHDGAQIEVSLSTQQPLIELLTTDDEIVMSHRDKKQKVVVGYFSDVAGNILLVDVQKGLRFEDIAEAGVVGINNRKAEVALSRQENAVRAVKYRESANPNLPAVLRDPKLAQVDASPISIKFRNQNLDQVKREAIKSALLAKDLYLVQGPPGTGKSSLIAELVWQVLQQNPKSRILVTSQSNVAVNHLVSVLARDYPEVSLVRVGREDKVAHGAEHYILREQVQNWSAKVAAASRAYINRRAEEGSSQPDLAPYLEVLGELEKDLSLLTSTRALMVPLEHDLGRNGTGLKISDPRQVNLALHRLGQLQVEERRLTKDLQAGMDLVREAYSALVLSQDSFNSAREYLERCLADRQASEVELETLGTIHADWIQRLGKQDEFERIFVKSVSVVAATCLGTAAGTVAQAEFDWVIIDEAARATTPELLVPAVRGQRVVLVGDHKQLPPLLASDLSDALLQEYGLDRAGLEKSLFERLTNSASDDLKVFLTHQYRMNKGIGELISDVFYSGGLVSAREPSPHPLPIYPKTIVWVSTSELENRAEQGGIRNRYNPVEVDVIIKLLGKLQRAYAGAGHDKEKPIRVGVITGYAEQARHIRQAVSAFERSYWSPLSLEIDTVDAFQGRQTEVVIYSVVRSNLEHRIGFLKDERRLNVALSRGENLLIIVGDHQHAKSAKTGTKDNPFASVFRHIEGHPDDCLLTRAEGIGSWS